MMVRLIFVVALAVLSRVASAEAPVPVTEWTVTEFLSSIGYHPTQVAACDAAFPFAKTKYNINGQLAPNGSCRWTVNGTLWQTSSMSSRTVNKCSDGSAPDTSKPWAEQCREKCPAPGTTGPTLEWTAGWRTGPDSKAAWAKGPNMPPSQGCFNGCKVSMYMSQMWSREGPGGYYESGFDLTSMHTGAICTGSPPDDGNPPPPSEPAPEKNRCPLGTVQIGIDEDGIPICRGKDTGGDGGGDGGGGDGGGGDGGGDGGGGGGTDPGGGETDPGTGGGGGDTEKQDFCKANPLLSVCRNSEISGSCGKVSCSGDAIQCAIAREIAARNCKDQEASDAIKNSAQYQLGEKVLNGNDPMADQLPTKDKASRWTMPSSFDNSGWIGGGSCFADKSFVVQGRTITIPFSRACDYLIVFRYVMMIIAAWISFRLLSGVILRK